MVTKTIKKTSKSPTKKPLCKSNSCSQTEVISRMSRILVGNGHPEDGLAFIVRRSADQLNDIKVSVESLHLKYQETLTAANTASSALEKYQAEVKGFESGQAVILAAGDKKFEKRMKVIGVILAILMAIFAYFNLQKQNRAILMDIQKSGSVQTPPIVDKK